MRLEDIGVAVERRKAAWTRAAEHGHDADAAGLQSAALGPENIEAGGVVGVVIEVNAPRGADMQVDRCDYDVRGIRFVVQQRKNGYETAATVVVCLVVYDYPRSWSPSDVGGNWRHYPRMMRAIELLVILPSD